MTRVLAVVAHPDDEVLGVGGTLLKHKAAGDSVAVYIAYPCRPESTLECEVAEQRLGIDYYRGYYVNALGIEDYIANLDAPDIVYTHSAADLHQDHLDVHHRTLVACRPQSGVKALYAFETPSATDWSGRPFIPQRFVDIGADIVGKLNAMQAYKSELRPLPHPRNIDALYARAEFWGQRVGVKYAEAIEVIRECA